MRLDKFLVSQTLEVAQHDHDPPRLAELGDCAVQGCLELTSLDLLDGAALARGQPRERLIAMARHAPLAGCQTVQAQARGDRVEPRRELRLAAELADGPVDP